MSSTGDEGARRFRD